MPIKKFRPTSPSLRKTQILARPELSGARPLKSLLKPKARSSGRNSYGRITVRRRGGGAKRRYRVVDFKRNRPGAIGARVQAIVYDPNRTGHLAQIAYADGLRAYILAPHGLKVGDIVENSPEADIRVGNSRPLKEIPVGTLVHNVELYPGAGGQLARAAGSSIQVMAKEGGVVLLGMPSGEVRKVRGECRATVGEMGNKDHELVKLGKAGRSRLKGRRPKVRGVVMNPIDHPHGGGEGRTSGGRHPVSPWGVPTKGYKTRRNKRTDRSIVKRRRK